jgi:hypothetical protein
MTLLAAFSDVCKRLDVPKDSLEAIAHLVEQLLRGALTRAKPNRRNAYLELFNELVCWLPDALRSDTAEERAAHMSRLVKEFRLKNLKGRKRSVNEAHPMTNAWRNREGVIWEAKVPQDPPDVRLDPPDADEWERFQRGEPVHQNDVIEPPADQSPIHFLRPRNQHEMLLTKYEEHYAKPKQNADWGSRQLRRELLKHVPKGLMESWFEGRCPTFSDLALLWAAHDVRLTPSLSNLPRLRQDLADARLMRRARALTSSDAASNPAAGHSSCKTPQGTLNPDASL